MQKPLSERATGLAVVVAGVTILSPDGLLTALISADPATILFWRGLLLGGTLIGWTLLRHRGASPGVFAAMGPAGLLIAVLFAASTAAFVYSILLAGVATALFVVATAPLFAALLGWLALGERVAPRTILAIAATLTGMAVIFHDGLGRGDAVGILVAVAAALCWAAMLVVLRRGRVADPAPALGAGGLLIALAMAPIAPTLAVSGDDMLWLCVLGLLVLPLSHALIGMGPRWLPAAEVGLLMLLEAVLGPLWAWIGIGQVPTGQTLLGGAIILGALAVNAAAGMAAERRRT